MSARVVRYAVVVAVALAIGITGTALYFGLQRNRQITQRANDVSAAFHTFICYAAQQQHPVHPPIFYRRILLKMHAGPCVPPQRGTT